MSPADFIDGRQRPVRRNPLIASILYYLKDIESFGTGLKRIADACRESGCRYGFDVQKSGFVVVFYRAESNVNYHDPINDPINDLLIMKENPGKESLLMACLRTKPSSTYRELAEIMDVSESTIKRMLQRLVCEKKIERSGSKKKGSWKILD